MTFRKKRRSARETVPGSKTNDVQQVDVETSRKKGMGREAPAGVHSARPSEGS